MSLFNLGYIDLTYEKHIGKSDRYNEMAYEVARTIKGIIYGAKTYNRNEKESNIVADYMCQTLTDVDNEDKINGYIVTGINPHYDIFGRFDYWEVSLKNG